MKEGCHGNLEEGSNWENGSNGDYVIGSMIRWCTLG